MNIMQLLGLGKTALADRSAVTDVVAAARVSMDPDGDGPLQPKPAYKTTEFWVFKVMPLMVFLLESVKGFVPPMWYMIVLLSFCALAFLGREALKMVHLWATRPAGGLPEIDLSSLSSDAKMVIDAFKVGKLVIQKTDLTPEDLAAAKVAADTLAKAA